MPDLSRRTFLTAAGGALAAAWLAADAAQLIAAGDYAARAGRADSPPPFKFLSADQATDLDAAASQIIPSDDTPGAHEARVVYFIDHGLDSWQKDQRPVFLKGIAELQARALKQDSSAKSFAALTDEQRHAVIASLENDKHEFFFVLRGATIAGMLTNPAYGGNYKKIGWKLIGFDDRYSWAPPFGWYDAHA